MFEFSLPFQIQVSIEETPKEGITKSESSLKLTEDIEKPTGIGSFGFANNKESGKPENGQDVGDKEQAAKSTNYFAQKPGDKVGFVFGGSTSTPSNSSGFGSLKSDSSDANANDGKDGEDAEESSKPASESGFQKVASREKLLEQASEYEKTHNNRQHFEEIDKFTGEEGEQHMLQVLISHRLTTNGNSVV